MKSDGATGSVPMGLLFGLVMAGVAGFWFGVPMLAGIIAICGSRG
jgi:hypothetical protein